MKRIQTGDRVRFDYPREFTMYPDLRAHSGQVVTVGVCIDATDPEVEPMFRIHAADGWTGEAFESELTPEGSKP